MPRNCGSPAPVATITALYSFFLNNTATTKIYPLPLHVSLPIPAVKRGQGCSFLSHFPLYECLRMNSARRSGMGCAFFATPAGCYAEKQWGSIRETHFQAEEILIVKAQRSAFSEPLAVIRITAARSPFGMTTPPRKATT